MAGDQDALSEALPQRDACRRMVDLLWLAYDEACEAELAALIADDLAEARLPKAKTLKMRLEPRRRSLPADTPVALTALARFDALLEVRIYALSAQTSFDVFPVVTSCLKIRPSAAEADVTALSRMKPNLRSMEMWLLYPKTGMAIIGSGVPSGRYRTFPPTFSVQRVIHRIRG